MRRSAIISHDADETLAGAKERSGALVAALFLQGSPVLVLPSSFSFSRLSLYQQQCVRIETPPLAGVPYLLLTLTSLFWAGNWVVGRAMHNDIPPVAMGFWRWAIALLILLPFAAPELKRNWHVVRVNWFTLALLGSLGATLFNAMIYVGLQYTTVTNGVLFNSVTPILIMVMSWLAFRERLGAWQTMGVVLSLAGVAVIVARGEPQILAALTFNRGDLWLISAMFLWAVYTIVLRRRRPG
jgi:drug/metabolite transporter (DMT)-like permease